MQLSAPLKLTQEMESIPTNFTFDWCGINLVHGSNKFISTSSSEFKSEDTPQQN